MTGTKSALQYGLRNKLAIDGDWSVATYEQTEEIDIQIQTEPGKVEDAARVVDENGGTVTSSNHDLVRATIEAGAIESVADAESVRLVHEPPELTLHGPIPDGVEQEEWEPASSDDLPLTEGVQLHGANRLHEAGFTGEDLTVAVLDSGFNVDNPRYGENVIATLGAEPGEELYEDAYETPGGHGDAVAEILHSFVPDADLVLADVFNATGQEDALETIDEEYPETTVANHSVGFAHTFRIDGEDPISQAISDWTERDEEDNRIFVNSAGNSARVDQAWEVEDDEVVPLDQGSLGESWHGEFTDSGDDLMDFEEADERDVGSDIPPEGDEIPPLENAQRLPVTTGFPVENVDDDSTVGFLSVHWDADFEEDDQRYEARLYATPDAEEPLEHPETGDPAVSETAQPFETFDVYAGWFEEAGDNIYLEIENTDATGDHTFDVWAQFNPSLNIGAPYATDARSVGIPALADDEDVLSAAAVQAVDVGDGEGETLTAFDRNADDLKSYSSQGPTQDGRRGVNAAGAAHVSTVARGPVEDVFGFNGTSSGAPHVAGIAALLFSVNNQADEVDLSTEEIRSLLEETGRGIADPAVGDPGDQNYQIGGGFGDAQAAGFELDVLEPAVEFPDQALVLPDDTEVAVQVADVEADSYVVLTEAADDYEGEEIIDFVEVEESIGEETLLLDAEDADPVDHAAHIVSDVSGDSLDEGEVSAETLEAVEDTDEAAIYAVSQFAWGNESSADAVETVTVDVVEILYEGEDGADEISIDLHEVDDGGIGGFVGISQEDLAVNETHTDVAIDVVEEVTPEAVAEGEAERVEDIIARTDEFFAMAHVGPAAEDDDGGRLPAGQPALLTIVEDDLAPLVGDFATVVVEDITLQIQSSIDIPDRTLVTDEDEQSELGSSQLTITAIKTADQGEELEVNASAAEDTEYNIGLFDGDLERIANEGGLSGNSTVSFETDDLDPGPYLIGATVGDQGVAAFPVLVKGYEVEITEAPSEVQTGSRLEITANIGESVDNPPEADQVGLFAFSESDENAIGVSQDFDELGEYEFEIDDPPADEYQFHTVVRGGEEIDFELQGVTTESADDEELEEEEIEPAFVDEIGGVEPLGLSDGEDVTVELDDGDVLSEVWVGETGTTEVSGNLQFSRAGVTNENVVVGGLDPEVTIHARNSGDIRETIEREGSLSDSSPVVVDGVAYVGDGGGAFHAIDVEGAELEWSVEDIGSAVTSTAAVGAGHVFFGTNDGYVHAVDLETGDKTWSTAVGDAVFSELEFVAAGASDVVFVTTTGGKLFGIDVGDGDVVVEIGPGAFVEGDVEDEENLDFFGSCSPVYEDGVLYVASDDVVRGLDVEATVEEGDLVSADGEWPVPNSGNAGADPVIGSDGELIIADAEGELNFWNSSGNSINSLSVSDEPLASTPAVAGSRIVIGTLEGELVVASPSSGVLERANLDAEVRAKPVVRSGNVYVGTRDGKVFNLQNLP